VVETFLNALGGYNASIFGVHFLRVGTVCSIET
jgi:hypothetical protein